MPNKLNLGSGNIPIPGYINYDVAYKHGFAGRHLSDWAADGVQMVDGAIYPLEVPADGPIAEIRAVHILEHFSYRETWAILQNWVECLAPGGLLRIAVPDFKKIAQQILADDGSDPEISFLLQGFLMGGHADEHDYHKAIFDEDGLTAALAALGLTDIERWESSIDDCARNPISLNLQGRKSEHATEYANHDAPTIIIEDADDEHLLDHPDPRCFGVKIEPGHIRAVMTAPRIGFLDNADCLINALRTLDIPWQRSGGALWTQGLQTAMNNALIMGAKYVLTLDYDTLFDMRDIETMYAYMEASEKIDAICPVQMRREYGTVLIGMGQVEGKPAQKVTQETFAPDVTQVATGHFGLTLIRLSSLKDLPKPWFVEHADEKGEYGDGRCDPDISFWHEWHKHGRSLYQANRVVVGHLELMATWPDKNMGPIVQTASEYQALGRPPRGRSNLWQ